MIAASRGGPASDLPVTSCRQCAHGARSRSEYTHRPSTAPRESVGCAQAARPERGVLRAPSALVRRAPEARLDPIEADSALAGAGWCRRRQTARRPVRSHRLGCVPAARGCTSMICATRATR